MSKCIKCPVREGGCIAASPGWSFACKLAEGTDSERKFVVDRSAIDAGTFVVVVPEPQGPPPADFAALRNATKLGSKNCWFSEHDAGCGCNGLQCHLLGRRINIYDCVKCLARW